MRLIPFIAILVTLGASVVMASCSYSGDAADNTVSCIDEAYGQLAHGDYARATEICNRLTASDDSLSLSWLDYCRLAAIYAAAYDHDFDTEASMASATKCMDKARSMQPDSVSAFISSMAHEYAAPLNTVVQTLDGLNTDRSTIGDHEESDYIEAPDSL